MIRGSEASTEAWVAELSAPGRGAIAALRIWGPDAVQVAGAAFRPRGGRSLSETPTGRLRVGRVGADPGDEVVAVVVSRDPPEVEVQCHGGLAAVALVRDALIAAGAEPASPHRWARRSTGSRLRTEAGEALFQAQTHQAGAILLDQLGGALEEALRGILERLDAGRMDQARGELDLLIERGGLGVRLVEGWRVVLAGRPNVGKSRLLNALIGFDRAIVSPEAGTTRDVVTSATAFEGWPIELADTAGLRAGALDLIEAAGIARARERQQGADLVVIVWDRSAPLLTEDRAVGFDHPGALIVASKADLPAAWDPTVAGADLVVSAERGDGIAALGAAIVARLGLQAPPTGSAVPFRMRQVDRLRAIRTHLDRGDPAQARKSLVRWLGSGRIRPTPGEAIS